MTRITEEMRNTGRSILLREVLEKAGIVQAELARQITNPRSGRPVSRALVNTLVNYGVTPTSMPEFKGKVEAYLSGHSAASAWLKANGHEIGDIWKPLNGAAKRGYLPAGHVSRVKAGFGPAKKGAPSFVLGNPEEMEIQKEVEMLTLEAQRHFKLFRNPFVNDVRDVGDIYLSEEHRYIEAAMEDSARHGGFIAVIGEVGSGKSVIRKKVVAELQKDENARIIFVKMIDKTRVTAASICDAIVLDLSDERPRQRLEQKTRQVERLLVARSKAGCHACLIIEEAHDLSVRVHKLLKRIHEIEDGYKKTLGIILIGQPELGNLYNEADHYDMREVIRRCQVAEIRGLNGNVKDYLDFKFSRINVDRKKVLTDGAVKALSDRLTARDERKRVISHAYPLSVNNWVVRAMNEAVLVGEKLVTEEVINSL